MLWLAIFTAWAAISFPLAIVVGRFIRGRVIDHASKRDDRP